MKETVKGLELKKLMLSSDDIAIRKKRFELQDQVAEIGNKIWKLGNEKKDLKDKATKLEDRERELLEFGKLDRERI